MRILLRMQGTTGLTFCKKITSRALGRTRQKVLAAGAAKTFWERSGFWPDHFFKKTARDACTTYTAVYPKLQPDNFTTEPIPACKYPQQVDACRKAGKGKIHARLRAQ